MSQNSAGRRQFLGGLLAAGLLPQPSWAEAGGPTYLAAAARDGGDFVLCGIDQDLQVLFQIPLPARGHAAAAHPERAEAVAFARRPGRFAIVIDCISGVERSRLHAPEGRHFYGHGAFSADGRWLFTTENDYELGQGRIGVWDVTAGYRRVDEFSSGGVGPHEIKRFPGRDTLVVANGGIDTHPDTGRTKLNIATMQPNLAYIDEGAVLETAQLPAKWHKNSIRHLAVSADGRVGFGMQWQGDQTPDALVGLHKQGGQIVTCRAPLKEVRAMQGYIGSIAFTRDESSLAVTSPRGGFVQIYDATSGELQTVQPIEDASGVATARGGVVVSAGTGLLHQMTVAGSGRALQTGLTWDNHLVSVTP